jgi:hypothetical protein
MAVYVARSSAVEVNGETVLSIVDGMGAFKQRAFDILAESGIKDPKPGQWYKQQAWLNAFKKIAQTIGGNTLNVIGKKIPENAKFPPGIDNLEKALASIDVAYKMNHRGGDIGHYAFKKTSDRSIVLTCDNPYPCEFDMGIISAMMVRFKPPSGIANLAHNPPLPCRKSGGAMCTYTVTW